MTIEHDMPDAAAAVEAAARRNADRLAEAYSLVQSLAFRLSKDAWQAMDPGLRERVDRFLGDRDD